MMMRRSDKIQVLSEVEFQTEAEVVLRRVFVNDDPYDQPFATGMHVRKILYEFWYELELPLLEAVMTAASDQGDRGFYVSVLERPAAKAQNRPYHWYVPFSDIAAYHLLVGPLQNAIYSPNGRWGIMASDEHHALPGGTVAFVKMIQKFIPNLENQVYEFLETWCANRANYGSKLDWLPGLLRHIYGSETAERLLREADLADLL
jgi:hypothetical protein